MVTGGAVSTKVTLDIRQRSTQRIHAGAGNSGVPQVEQFQVAQSMKLSQSCIRNPAAIKIQFPQLLELRQNPALASEICAPNRFSRRSFFRLLRCSMPESVTLTP